MSSAHFLHVLSHPEPIEFRPTTELIHLLGYNSQLSGGGDRTMWPDLCQSCWREAHKPAVRPKPGLQLVKTRPCWTGTER
jgi:hypothetical protein